MNEALKEVFGFVSKWAVEDRECGFTKKGSDWWFTHRCYVYQLFTSKMGKPILKAFAMQPEPNILFIVPVSPSEIHFLQLMTLLHA